MAKLLSPLSRSQYTVNSKKHFIKSIKHEKSPASYQMISFEVKSLFISIPLDKTIEIILQRIYNRNKIITQNPKKVFKELLLLCTSKLHFAYSSGVHQQNWCGHGVTFRSSPCWYIHGRTRNIHSTNFRQFVIEMKKICRRHIFLAVTSRLMSNCL